MTRLSSFMGLLTVGAALVMHLVSFGPVTILGLVFMAQEGLRLRGMRELTTAPSQGQDSVDSENGSQT